MGNSQIYRKLDQADILISIPGKTEIIFSEKHLEAIKLSEKFKKIIGETFATAVVLSDIIGCLKRYKGQNMEIPSIISRKNSGFFSKEIITQICEELKGGSTNIYFSLGDVCMD